MRQRTVGKGRRLMPFYALVFLLAVVSVASAAQTYDFSVSDLRMQVFVQPDASAHIIYDITFANSPFARGIDIVDVGTPHENYDLESMRASLDGVELTDIRVSEFVDPGVEVHLEDQTIAPGETGTLHFEFTMPDMVFQDTTQDDYASLQITPTWFDGEFVSGSTDVWIVVHLLPEVLPDEVLFQDVPFTDKALFEEHSIVAWRWENGQATGPNQVGVSFPKRGMSKVIEQSLLDITVKFLEDNPGVRWILGALTLGLLALAFFRFSGGTGLTVFVLLGGGLILLLANNAAWQLLALPAVLVLVGLNEWSLARRKERYLPAIAQVEGGGIKRGLTAPEAAVLLELPLNKVLTLIIFGLLEKGIVRQVDDSPLKVEVLLEFQAVDLKRKERRGRRLDAAQRMGTVMRSYEHPFLDLIEENSKKPLHEIDFSGPMKELIEQTAERVQGFDLSDTQEYYRKIISRALQEAKRIGDLPERERYLDRHLQWLLLDDDYPTVFTTRSYRYRPIWVRPFASSDRLSPSLPSSKSPAPSPGGRTSFSDVAGSFAGWTENTMGNLASSIAPGSLQVKGPTGVVNLSGVDKVTGDVFKALATSSGSSGGSGGSGCACACAGCACACACAGGGR